MIHALTKGKVSSKLECLEDLLTSSVFGCLLYFVDERLMPYVKEAVTLDDSRPLMKTHGVHNLSCDFWPKFELSEGTKCEPDVVIRFSDDARNKYIVFIEAKYKGGKHLHARKHDQLSTQYRALTLAAIQENAIPTLIYLTRDLGRPDAAIIESINEYNMHSSSTGHKDDHYCSDLPVEPRIAWLSWQCLDKMLRDSKKAPAPIDRDLLALLERLNLTAFTGVSTPEKQASWNYSISYSFADEQPVPEWLFSYHFFRFTIPTTDWEYFNGQ